MTEPGIFLEVNRDEVEFLFHTDGKVVPNVAHQVERYFRMMFMMSRDVDSKVCAKFTGASFPYIQSGLDTQDGFSNPNHRCYINTAVQALLSSPIFVTMLKRFGVDDLMLRALREIALVFAASAECSVSSTIEDRTTAWNKTEALMGVILKQLPNSLKGKTPNCPSEVINVILEKLVFAGVDRKRLYVQMQTFAKCKTCSSEWKSKSEFTIGTYNLNHDWARHQFGQPMTQEYTLKDVFEYFFAPETITKHCEQCGEQRPVAEEYAMVSMPDVLFMFLNRKTFDKATNSMLRLNVNVAPAPTVKLGNKTFKPVNYLLHQKHLHLVYDDKDAETYLAVNDGHW